MYHIIMTEIFCFKAYPYMNSLELGVGWAAAVADDPAELEFFQKNNRISSDDRDYYWIGGLTYDTLDERNKRKYRVSLCLFLDCTHKEKFF